MIHVVLNCQIVCVYSDDGLPLKNVKIPDISLFTAMKIHISHPTKALLETTGGYEMELRGEMEIKV